MTDTVTIEEAVPLWIERLQRERDEAVARIDSERIAFERKRDSTVEVAHRLGNENSIGEALDDLLEEFDLPRRPTRVSTYGWVRLYMPVTGFGGNSGGYAVTEGGTYLYHARGMEVALTQNLGHTHNLDPDSECGCVQVEDAMREALRSYYGAANAGLAAARFQITHPSCTGDDCPNTRQYDQPTAVDWASLPMHTVGTVTPA